MAMGPCGKRRRNSATQECKASGCCSTTRCSTSAEPLGLQANIMLLIGPVQTDPGHDGVGKRSGMIHGKSSGKRWENTLARNLHSPYSKVLAGRHLSMRCRSERPAPLEALRVIVEQSGRPIRSGAGRVLRHPSYLFPARFSSTTKQVSICAKGPAPAALNPNTYKGTSGESEVALL